MFEHPAGVCLVLGDDVGEERAAGEGVEDGEGKQEIDERDAFADISS